MFLLTDLFESHIFRLIVIMFLCGLGGGLINYLINSNVKVNGKNNVELEKLLKPNDSLGKCVIIGVGASFLVPLLLKMISSDILETSGKNALDYFVLAGFCLTAAISSRAFIFTISEKILRLVKEAKDVAEKNSKDLKETEVKIEKIEDKFVEPDFEKDRDSSDDSSLNTTDLSDSEFKILESFANSNFIYRSLKNLAKENKVSTEEVSRILDSLVAKKYIEKVFRKTGERYTLTFLGRTIIMENNAL